MTKVVGVAPTAPMRPMRSPKKGIKQARKQVEQTYLNEGGEGEGVRMNE